MTALRYRLSSDACFGIFSKTLDSALIEAAGYAGLDFIILDTEHGPADWQTVHNHIRAARLTKMAPIVRVKGIDAHAISTALDAGAEGVQVPNIVTAQQAAEAVAAAKFHPLGSRGVCRFVRAAHYGDMQKERYFNAANEALLILQVEGVDGVKNIESILDVPGFDVLFIGPYDLSQSVGRPGEVEAPEVLEMINLIRSAALSANKALGIFCDTPEALARYREMRIPYISYSVDISLFRDGLVALRSKE